jgi:hypothetical protein
MTTVIEEAARWFLKPRRADLVAKFRESAVLALKPLIQSCCP